MLPSHVREAKRLLHNSIIAVDHKDISMDLEVISSLHPLGASRSKEWAQVTTPLDVQEEEENVREKDFEAILQERQKAQATGGGQEQAEGDMAIDGEGKGGEARAAQEREEEAEDMDEDGDEEEAAGAGKRKRAERTRFEMSFEAYQRTKTLLVHKLREQGEGEGELGSMQEKDLLNWFVMHQVDRGLLSTADEMKQKFKESMAVVRKLIKEGVFVVTQEPAPEGEGESRLAERRLQRYLAVNHNYHPDE